MFYGSVKVSQRKTGKNVHAPVDEEGGGREREEAFRKDGVRNEYVRDSEGIAGLGTDYDVVEFLARTNLG